MELTGLPAVIFIILLLCIFLCILATPVFITINVLSRFKRKATEELTRSANTIIAHYDPPQNLSPAEVGYLYDQTLDDREIWATLYDLQNRSVISISGTTITKLATKQEIALLKDYEQTAIKIRINKRGKFRQDDRTRFLAQVHDTLEKQGYFKAGYMVSVAYILGPTILILWSWPLLLASMPGTYNGVPYQPWSLDAFTSSFWFAFIFGFVLWPLYFFGALYIVSLIIKHAGIFWLGTKKLRMLWPQLDGYREYLRQTDLDNVQFELQQDGKSTNKNLPYILALNLPINFRKK